MSTTIDSRVVEMRFDNKQFEANVQTSMSTLSKLKQSLNLTGASKGLEGLNAAAKNNNIGMLGSAAETVGLKFNAMYTIADQALRNITTSVQRTATNMVKALTIDPIKTGLQEYETQIGAIQTILANTQHQGTTIDDVNAALDELNTYADKTIYNFTEMTRNIGTFTAAGLDLQTSTESIKGIANLAAVSGSTSQQASTAMYQLSQALSTGTVRLQDWNSVVNAGMGGKVFQDALIRTSELMGTGAQAAIDAYGSFRDSLTQGEWLTTEVLSETLKQFAGVYDEADLMAQGFTEKQAKDIAALAQTAEDAATKVKTFTQLIDTLKESAQSGWTQSWEYIIGDFEESKRLWTTVSDIVGGMIGGMSDSRNRVLGSAFDSSWDKMIDYLGGKGIQSTALEDSIREVAEAAKIDLDPLLKKYGDLEHIFQAGALSSDLLSEALDNLSGSTADLDKVTDNLDMGDTGEQVKEVQKALEFLGLDLGEAGVDGVIGEYTEAAIKAFQKAEGLKVDGIVGPDTLAALKEATKGMESLSDECSQFTDNMDDIGAREHIFLSIQNTLTGLCKVFSAIGGAWNTIFPEEERAATIERIAEAIHNFSEKLVLSDYKAAQLKRTFRGLFAILDIIGTFVGGAFKIGFQVLSTILGMFDMNILDLTSKIGDMLVNFRNWLDENNLLIKAIEFIVPLIVNMVLAIADFIKMLWNLPIVQNGIKKVIDTIKSFGKAIKNFATDGVKRIKEFVKRWQDFFSMFEDASIFDPKVLETMVRDFMINVLGISADFANNFIENVKGGFAKVKEYFGGLLDGVPEDIIAGFNEGIWAGIKNAVNTILEFGKSILAAIKDYLGIHSPSTKFYEIAYNCIEGFVNGIKAAVNWVVGVVKGIASKIAEAFKGWFDKAGVTFAGAKETMQEFANNIKEAVSSIKWEKVLTALSAVGVIALIKKVIDIVSSFAGLGDALKDVLGTVNKILEKDVSKVIKNFAGVEKAFARSLKADAFKTTAEAIAIMVGALTVLCFLPVDKLKNGAIVMGGIIIALLGLQIALDKFASTGVSLDKKGKTLKLDGLKAGLLGIAAAVLLMGITMKIIGGMDPDEFGQAIKGMIIAVGLMAGLMFAFGKFVDADKSGNIDKAGIMLKKMATSLLIMAIAVKIIGGFDQTDIINGLGFITVFGIFVAAMMWITDGAGADVDKVGSMMIKLSAALLLMAVAVGIIGTFNPGTILKGVGFMAAFGVFVWAMVSIVKKVEKDIPKVAGTIIAMSAAMLLMAVAVGIVGSFEIGTILKGGAALLGFVGLMALMVKMVKSLGNQTTKVAATIMGMAVAIGIMAGVAVLLGLIDKESLIKGIAAVSVLGAVVSLMAHSLKGANNVMGTMIAMAAAIAVMTIAVGTLAMIDSAKLIIATASLSVLIGMFALLTKSTKDVTGAMGSLIVMTVAVGILGGILYLLSGMDTTSTLTTALSLSVLMLALSAAFKIASGAGTVAPQALIAMGVMAAIVAVLGIILGVLNKYDLNTSIETAVSLSVLLLALSAATLILSKVGAGAGAAVSGAAGLMAIVILIGGVALLIGGLMSLIPQETVEKWKTGLQSFIDFIIILAGGLGDAIGAFIGGAIGGSLEKFASCLNTLADSVQTFGTKISGIDATKVDAVTNLSTMLTNIAGGTILDSIAKFITGSSSMETFKTQLTAFGDAVVGFSDKVSGSIDEESVTAATNAGKMLAALQGDIQGEGGLLQFIMGEKNLGSFGTQLTEFGTAIVGFSNAVSGGINEEAITAAANAGQVMAALQSDIQPSGGLVQWIMGEKNLGDFGTQLAAYGAAISSFSNAVSGGISEEAVTAAANAGQVMASLQSDIQPSGGLIGWIVGEKNLADFGTQLTAYGNAIVGFSNAVSGGINQEAVQAAADAGSIMATLAQQVEPTGGLIDWIVGHSDLETFGTQISAFGTHIAAFASSIGTGINEEAVESVKNAGLMMTELDAAIPTDKWFDGKVSMETFGTQISSFGEKLVGFGTTVAEFDSTKVESVMTQANSLATFASDISDLDTTGLWMFSDISAVADAMYNYNESVKDIDTEVVSSSISSANRLKNFINSLVDLDNSGVTKFSLGTIGTAMKNYAAKVADLDPSTVSSSISAANRLKNFINSLADLDNSGIGKFKVGTIGSTLKSYAGSVADVDSGAISSSISAANKIKNFINSLAGMDSSGVGGFVKAINELGTVSMSKVTEAFSGATETLTGIGSKMVNGLARGIKEAQSKVTSNMKSILDTVYKDAKSKADTFNKIGSTMATTLASGISSTKGKAMSAAGSMASAAASSARNYYNSFFSAGSWLVSGFCAGISANTFRAAAKAAAMANEAERAAKQALNINSPSRVFAAIGSGVVEGFVKGISDNESDTGIAVTSLAKTATKSFSNAINKVNDILNTDMDMQPTIRPVLDLSDVESGAATIGRMFGMGSSIGVTSNLGAISSMMANRNQNGGNDDVISAINKLGKSLGNVGNTTYNVNGVNASDDAAVVDAVKTLIRAAKIERRV